MAAISGNGLINSFRHVGECALQCFILKILLHSKTSIHFIITTIKWQCGMLITTIVVVSIPH